MTDRPQTTPYESGAYLREIFDITPEMISAGRAALEEVLERHGLEGVLALGCFSNALSAAYLAMEAARAKSWHLYT